MDDDPKSGAGEPGKEEPAKGPSDEDIDAWVKAAPALDLGEGVKLDDAALRAMAPSLMGLKKEDADKVLQAYAGYSKEAARKQAEADNAFNAGLVKECEKRFGADLKKTIADAKRGGRAIFGDTLWNVMKSVPSFANNPDMMERLAEYGRKIATDGGKLAPQGDGEPGDRGDVLHRMYGGLKV